MGGSTDKASETPGYVLAGGASRRMGQDKALMSWKGTILAADRARVLAEAGCAPAVLVGQQAGLQGHGFEVLREGDHPGHHPLFGLGAALEHASSLDPPAELALVMACDLIAIEPALVEAFIAEGSPVIALDPQGRRALFGVLPTAMGPAAWQAALDGRSVQRFLGELPVRPLSELALHNANRPEDLALH